MSCALVCKQELHAFPDYVTKCNKTQTSGLFLIRLLSPRFWKKCCYHSYKVFQLITQCLKYFSQVLTALLTVLNDILISCDSGDFVVLVLLDLTANFDRVGHAVLITLEHCIGLRANCSFRLVHIVFYIQELFSQDG